MEPRVRSSLSPASGPIQRPDGGNVRMVSDTDGNSIRGSFLEHCRSSAAFEAAPDLLADFAERYVRRSPSDYLASVDPDQFCAQVADIFAFAAVRPRDEIAVRVFNPTLATHGYEPGGAVVQVAAGDVPFLIDSVSNEIQAGDLDVQWKIHPVIGVERDDGGALTAIVTARTASHRDSIQHYELQRTLDDDELAALTESVHSVLHSVRSAVTDFEENAGCDLPHDPGREGWSRSLRARRDRRGGGLSRVVARRQLRISRVPRVLHRRYPRGGGHFGRPRLRARNSAPRHRLEVRAAHAVEDAVGRLPTAYGRRPPSGSHEDQ